MSKTLKDQYASSPLNGNNATAVEALYELYLRDPNSVSAGWQRYFRTLGADAAEPQHGAVREKLIARASAGRSKGRATGVSVDGVAPNEKQAAVSRMIQVFCLRGHQIADIDPLGLMERPVPGVLKLDYLGLLF